MATRFATIKYVSPSCTTRSIAQTGSLSSRGVSLTDHPRISAARSARFGSTRAQPTVANYDSEIDTDSIRVPKVPTSPPPSNPEPGLVRQRPPPNTPRRDRTREMPMNRRKSLSLGFAGVLAVTAFQRYSEGKVTGTREIIRQGQMVAGLKTVTNPRYPGDKMIIGDNGMYYMGADGLRVDINENVYVEKTDKEGNLIDLTLMGNLRDGTFDFLDDYDSEGRPLRR